MGNFGTLIHSELTSSLSATLRALALGLIRPFGRLLVPVVLLMQLQACKLGVNGPQSDPIVTHIGPDTVTYPVTPSVTNVSISPSGVQTVAEGSSQAFVVTPAEGYTLSETVDSDCAEEGSWSGNVYTSGAITSACSVSFSATINTYTVTYKGNGNDGAPMDSSSPYNYNSTVSVASAGTLTKAGYTFDGWNTAADGSGTARAAASTFALGAANVTLYAQWTINTYTVTYDGNGNDGGSAPTDSSSPYNYNSTVTVAAAGTLTKTGYTFDGWNTAADGSGTARAAASTFALGAANVTLYAQWTVIPVTIGLTYKLTSWFNIAVSYDGSTIAAGEAGDAQDRFVVSTDGGLTWNTSNASGPYAAIINGSAEASSGDFMAGSSNGAMRVRGSSFSTDSGASYTPYLPGSHVGGTWARSVAASSSGAVLGGAFGSGMDWCNGQYVFCGGALYLSTDFGANWFASMSGNITGVAISSDGSIVFAASPGTGYGNNNDGYIYKSTDSGSSWNVTGAPAGSWYHLASSADTSKLAAISASSLYYSSDSGDSWAGRSGAWNNLAMSGDGSKLVASKASSGSGGILYASTDGGSSWSLTSPPSSEGIGTRALASSADGVNLVAAETWYVYGYDWMGNWGVQGLKGGIYVSHDSGVTWIQKRKEYGERYNNVASSADGTTLSAISDPNTLWISTDSGENWTSSSGPGTGTYGRLSSSSDGSTLFYSTNVLSKTSNQGGTWSDITPSSWTGGSASNVAVSSDGLKLVVGESGGLVRTSNDGGATWTDQTALGAKNWNSVASSPDGTKIAAADLSGYIYTSTDSGANWTEHAGSTGGGCWQGITISSDGSKLAGATCGGYIYTSSDGGVNWVARSEVGGSRGWAAIAGSSDGSRIVVGDWEHSPIYTFSP